MPLAALLGFMALALLWAGLGLSELLPRPGVAVAGSQDQDRNAAPLALSRERANLLQSSVDSVALSLGSAFAGPSSLSGDDKKNVLHAALSGLTFGLGGEVYFTAWQGTRMLHSPLSPDAADMDFAEALDERGAAFVRSMESVAPEGGFVQVTLPRQFADREPGKRPLLRNLDDAEVTKALESLAGGLERGTAPRKSAPVALRGTINLHDDPSALAEVVPVEAERCALGAECGRALLCPDSPALAQREPRDFSSAPVEQVVYARRIPNSDWHIAAFMPLSPLPNAEDGFSAAWTCGSPEEAAAENMFRKGLSVSGFSLAGLAGLMLSPGIGRGGKNRETPEGDAEVEGNPA